MVLANHLHKQYGKRYEKTRDQFVRLAVGIAGCSVKYRFMMMNTTTSFQTTTGWVSTIPMPAYIACPQGHSGPGCTFTPLLMKWLSQLVITPYGLRCGLYDVVAPNGPERFVHATSKDPV